MSASKILITGAGGFIGSHLTELCVKQGHRVRAFLRYNSQYSRGWLERSDVLNDVEVVFGDIRDSETIFSAMKNHDIVFHLAALIGIPYSRISPHAYIETNITGAFNVLQASRKQNMRQVIMTSTSETYGTAQYVPVDEKHPLLAQSFYAASKIASDQMALSFYHSFGLPVKIIRPFNAYGPRQSARAIVPTIITQLLRGNSTIQLGNLNPTRDFTYVTDLAKAYLNVAESDAFWGSSVNVGMNREVSIGDLAKKIGRLMGVEVVIKTDTERVRAEYMEVERLCCNNKNIFEKSSWKPAYNLESGLKETIRWFKKNIDLYKNKTYHI